MNDKDRTSTAILTLRHCGEFETGPMTELLEHVVEKEKAFSCEDVLVSPEFNDSNADEIVEDYIRYMYDDHSKSLATRFLEDPDNRKAFMNDYVLLSNLFSIFDGTPAQGFMAVENEQQIIDLLLKGYGVLDQDVY